jgi:hypothetical protein
VSRSTGDVIEPRVSTRNRAPRTASLSEADLDALRRISNERLVRLYLWDDVPVSMVQIEGILEQSVGESAK